MGIRHAMTRHLRSCRAWTSAVSQTTMRAGRTRTATRSTTAPPLVVAFLMLLMTVVMMIPCTHGATTSKDVCERLSERSLQYTQEKAPRDLSGLLPVVVKRINQVLPGVVDVEVEWHGGDLHGTVGEHIVKARVTRLASEATSSQLSDATTKQQPITTTRDEDGRSVVTQCFEVPFTITDTNECMLAESHPMRHKCHSTAQCINTVGSYECLCPRFIVSATTEVPMDSVRLLPHETASDDFWVAIEREETQRGPWERSLASASRSSCPGRVSTHGCCPERVHSKGPEATECRANFRCPVDPCQSNHTCATNAKCVRKASPLVEADGVPEDDDNKNYNYICQCATGLMGNGHRCRPGVDPKPEPKVKFDGVTPTELTVQNNYYCGCTKPVVDACSGFPPCEGKHQICIIGPTQQPMCGCKPGYVQHEVYGCVDESPPELRLRNDPKGDHILRLKQGDVYQEYAVDILDENAEEYLRSLKIAYSQPLPHGCLTQIGEFHVNYTVATPWTSPPYIRKTRRVIVEDFDECRAAEDGKKLRVLEETCPILVPRCDVAGGAKCVNTVGSYTCQCPDFTAGDGYLAGAYAMDDPNLPSGYQGGQGCHDVGIPEIHVLGPNPKVFRVCECGGISGVMGPNGNGVNPNSGDIKAAHQAHYGDDIKTLIRKSSGAELCATHSNPMPRASECVEAHDLTFKGRVDLTREVTVGDPVQKAPLQWAVPYNVKDSAGNAAVTVWRDVIVEEVNLKDLETNIRNEVLQQQKAETQRAVDRALAEDRRKRMDSPPTRKSSTEGCPECPPCTCTGDGVDEAQCQATCPAQTHFCPSSQESAVVQFLLIAESFFPPSVIPPLLIVVGILVGIFLFRILYSLLFGLSSNRTGYYDYEERERKLQESVMYYDSDDGPANGGAMLPPRSSLSTENGGFLTPSATGYSPRGSTTGISGQRPSPGGDINGIYRTTIITPKKKGAGDGSLSHSPYGPRS